MFYCYILESLKDGSFYIGITGNLEKRVSFHNKGKVRYTNTRKPFRLFYFEAFKTLSEAYKREKQIKSWKKRKAIERLVSKNGVIHGLPRSSSG